jgi:hypothetical protein
MCYADNYPGFLENELQSLRDSVEYVNTLQGLKCNELVDIMEDFQDFKKSGGINILSKNENLWFFCFDFFSLGFWRLQPSPRSQNTPELL